MKQVTYIHLNQSYWGFHNYATHVLFFQTKSYALTLILLIMLGKTSWYSIDISGNDSHILLFYKECHFCHMLLFAKIGQNRFEMNWKWEGTHLSAHSYFMWEEDGHQAGHRQTPQADPQGRTSHTGHRCLSGSHHQTWWSPLMGAGNKKQRDSKAKGQLQRNKFDIIFDEVYTFQPF